MTGFGLTLTRRRAANPYRLQGAINLQARPRSNPPRWWETTWAERVGCVATVDQREAAMPRWSGRVRVFGRGASRERIPREADPGNVGGHAGM